MQILSIADPFKQSENNCAGQFCNNCVNSYVNIENGGTTLKKREIKYDFLRTVAVFAIIMVHSIPAVAVNDKQWWFAATIQPLLLCFVGIYFMLSGLFLLDSATGSITDFYKNRARVIGIPFLFYAVLYYIFDICHNQVLLQWWEYPAEFLKAFLNGTVPMADHMWFMYTIVALYLCTPFLARLMKAMSDKELMYFVVLMMVIQAASTYFTVFGIDLGNVFQYMVFKGWVIYFVLGYALKRLCKREYYQRFVLAGAAGFFITLLQKRWTPGFTPGIHDLAPTMIAMSAAVFLFFEYYGDIKFPYIKMVVSFLSRHSYSAYLIHYLMLRCVAQKIVDGTMVRHFYVPRILCLTVMTAVLSYSAAVLLDYTVIGQLQSLVRKRISE